jgi:2-polyprenyl-3-methyl-5-hydroxy-6-metoxy-1,4-benzoquinol methylase
MMHKLKDYLVRACRACPVCDGREVERLHTQRFVLAEGHPLAGGYDVVHCDACGFVYADVQATQAEYDAFYSRFSKYDDATHGSGSGESPNDAQRLDEMAEIVAAALDAAARRSAALSSGTLNGALNSRAARVLDIGCAGGGFLAALKRRGFTRLTGIDPSAQCVRMTRDRVGEAYQGWLTSIPAAGPVALGQFDCVVLSHVLEHVLDVKGAIAALAPLLTTAGILYIEVPDATRYDSHIHAPFQDFNTEHINHFSAICLNNAVSRQGFEVIGDGSRTVRPSEQTTYPAVYGIYRPGGGFSGIVRDLDLKTSILRYIERSAVLLGAIDRFIGQAMETSPELIVWGVGQLTLKLLAETQLAKAKIVAFVDSNPIHQGGRLFGAPILAPSALRDYPQPILVGTLLHQREISEQIQGLGLTNRILLLPENS